MSRYTGTARNPCFVESSFFALVLEDGFGDEVDCDLAVVEVLSVERVSEADSALHVVVLEFDPNVSVGALLDINPVHFAEVGAEALDLVFNVDEEGRGLDQVDLQCIEHVSHE